MVAIGILTGLGLWVIGVPMWLPLAILAALLNFIPNFGPIIAAVPALLIALANDPTDALWVAGLYVLAQNLEGYLIMPLVQRRAVEMPPALTIMSQVLLGMLLGPLGVVLAAPLTAAALVLIKMLYVQDTLRTATELPSDNKGKGKDDEQTSETTAEKR
jgi:predicted PurR-regulated permease PerM